MTRFMFNNTFRPERSHAGLFWCNKTLPLNAAAQAPQATYPSTAALEPPKQEPFERSLAYSHSVMYLRVAARAAVSTPSLGTQPTS
jgi:hypothetical protein